MVLPDSCDSYYSWSIPTSNFTHHFRSYRLSAIGIQYSAIRNPHSSLPLPPPCSRCSRWLIRFRFSACRRIMARERRTSRWPILNRTHLASRPPSLPNCGRSYSSCSPATAASNKPPSTTPNGAISSGIRSGGGVRVQRSGASFALRATSNQDHTARNSLLVTGRCNRALLPATTARRTVVLSY